AQKLDGGTAGVGQRVFLHRNAVLRLPEWRFRHRHRVPPCCCCGAWLAEPPRTGKPADSREPWDRRRAGTGARRTLVPRLRAMTQAAATHIAASDAPATPRAAHASWLRWLVVLIPY